MIKKCLWKKPPFSSWSLDILVTHTAKLRYHLYLSYVLLKSCDSLDTVIPIQKMCSVVFLQNVVDI